ncbi:cytochrome P450 89A2-like [Tripterygium wilfordii]|uniref:cytochrome P450 89A2-like n=1 Tax=Tripterygium wilfordii TaxID=458696 RepID=UPI0018F7EC48|nr:cytochrome P450 89A2-like [Tripterygium wilfordii]
MDIWFMLLISISIAALLKPLINLLIPTNKLPPGPRRIPIISDLLWLRRTPADSEPILRSLHANLGPIITLRIWSRTSIFVADRYLAHKALVQNGAVFADRPPCLTTRKILTCNQGNINSASYGPNWRLFRRNLTSEILNPSRVRAYSHARKWVLQILIDRLVSDSKSGEPIRVMEHFKFAMFCLLVLMCFGDKVTEDKIKEIEEFQRRAFLNSRRSSLMNFWPSVTKIVFRKWWEEFFQFCKYREDVLIPLIRARKNVKKESLSKSEEDKEEYVLSYVDTLFDLELPEGKRKLDEREMVPLCSEFLNGGTDTTSTALQWIMANLVKYPHIQEKLFREIKGNIVGDGDGVVKEDDLQRMPYLKAVVLEGLRRHPPGHFVLPHAVIEDVMLDKYLIPKNGTVNFMLAEMGWDPKVWEDPMGFKPERFIGSDGEVVFDITGSKEIKMMPFGVGRRICPGFGLAMLHLEYFVANLVLNFEWKARDGDEVDLSEKQEFTIVMKNPLQTHISPRSKLSLN